MPVSALKSDWLGRKTINTSRRCLAPRDMPEKIVKSSMMYCPFAEKDFEIVNSLVSSRDERTTYSNDRTSG